MSPIAESANQLREALRRIRRGWRMRVLLEGLARVAATVLVALVAGALISAVAGPGSMTVVTVRFLGYLLIGAATLKFLILPAIRRPDDATLALYVEEGAPEIRQALLSAVQALDAPEDTHTSTGLSALVVRKAVEEVERLESGPGLERPRLRRAAALFAGAAAAMAFLLLAGPRVLRDTARVLFVPWSEAEAAPVLAVLVTPGDASVPRGGAIELRATLRGFASEGAELAIRPDTAQEWIRIPMLRDSTAGGFSARLFDLTRATEYYVESDAIRSRAYHLTVTNLPAVQKLALELRFPAYTGKSPELIEEGGDVAAVVGTTVIVHATTTMPVRGGSLQLDGGITVPMAGDSAGTLSGSFRIKRDGFYRVDLMTPDGTPVAGGVQYAIEALEDHAPILRIEEPGRDTKVTSVEEVTVAVRASDDYGVSGLDLRYSVNGGAEQRISLSDSTARRASPELRAAHTLFLEEMGLKAGDLVAYHATAKDAVGNTASSDIYFLEIRPFGRDYHQAEQGGGGQGQGQNDSPDGLSARQREIVAGTFNWLRDSAKTAEKRRREDLTTLAISQSRLKEDVAGLARRLLERNAASVDTGFRAIHAQLDTASREMQTAEEQLGSGRPNDALPPEQKALQHLQRAEALYRDVQVQMGQQGGGGGGAGSQSKAEDLADLFELETDKLKNQYESVQQDQAQSAQKELDATAERLKQLASRQQQENERMQRMADAMQQRLGQSGGSGGGSSQRELARQAEEEARRLERLARERNDPTLADAARRLQESADAMRKAASGGQSGSQQGNAALDKLRNATKDLENARASQLSDAVKGLAKRAEELSARQKEIGEGVSELGQTPGAERAEKLRRLDERKDGLAGDVDRLENDAQRLSREAQRDQRGAAGKLGQAAEAIRDTRIRDKVVYSKSVMRGGSPAYAQTLEDQIAGNLGDVSDRLKEAAGALTENGEARGDRTLEQARELVRGLESLRQRIADRADPNRGDPNGQGQQGQSGQPGQQGQQGQQGQNGQPGKSGQGQNGQQGQGGAQQGQGQGQGGQGQPPGQGGRSGQGGQQGGGGGMGSAEGNGGGQARLAPGDVRQFQREFGLRREAAESLRRELFRQNLEAGDLGKIIDDLRRLESGRPFANPKGLEDLQRAVVEGLKSWEFKLWRTLGQGKNGQPALGGPSEAPPAYRALVEEYYRSLSRKAPPKP